MSVEKVIQEILSKRPEISREEVLERLRKEKSKTNGLISDEILLRMVGAEFGVDFSNNMSVHTLSSTDLVPGLNDVTVVGRVVAVFPPKNFEGKARSGEVASLLVVDEKGVFRVVFWNSKTSMIKSGLLKTGQIVRFSHAYTREDYSGKVEVHLGEKSEVEVNPSDVGEKDYPTIEKFTEKIGEISGVGGNRKVCLSGFVKAVFPSSTFTRRDLSSGKVLRFALADETGEVSVVVWNEKVDELESMLREGLALVLVNAKVRKALNSKLEVHVDSGTYVEPVSHVERFWKIADLKDGLSGVNVEGEVASKPLVQDVKTSRGEVVKLAVFELRDETGKIWFSAWRNHAEAFSNMKVGSRIAVKNAYVRKGFEDQLELSTREATTIAIIN